MKISFFTIGIEVAETVVEVLSSDAPPDPSRSETAGTHPFRLIPQHYRTGLSVIFEVPDGPEELPGEALQQMRSGGAAGKAGEALPGFLAETGRLGLKAALARGALLALPALAVLVVPRIARAALPAAGRNRTLRKWVAGLLPVQQPRLPPTP